MREVLSYSLILSVPVPGCRQVLSTYLGQHIQKAETILFRLFSIPPAISSSLLLLSDTAGRTGSFLRFLLEKIILVLLNERRIRPMRMKYIRSPRIDPSFNLALEQYVFDALDRSFGYFMLWQNDNTIVVGKHQNTVEEINAAYVKEHGIQVVRRLSGGGAVYHDLGNLCFTFITDQKDGVPFDFSLFCRPVVRALAEIGVTAEISGRNDILIDGQKFSGNAQYRKQGRVMHHGTLMFDSDLDVVGQALRVPEDKIASKGIKSVRSRVTNIKPYAPEGMTLSAFEAALVSHMFQEFEMEELTLAPADLAEVERLRQERYVKWEWNYGFSPSFQIQKSRRVENCGRIEVRMNVEDGVIRDIDFHGDYFGDGDPAELSERLKGLPLREDTLRSSLSTLHLPDYFSNMELETFLSILLQ